MIDALRALPPLGNDTVDFEDGADLIDLREFGDLALNPGNFTEVLVAPGQVAVEFTGDTLGGVLTILKATFTTLDASDFIV